MPKKLKKQIWSDYKDALSNIVDPPQNFLDIRWHTPKGQMENALEQLEKLLQQEYRYIDVEEAKDETIIDILDDDIENHIPEVKEAVEKALGDNKEGKKQLLVRFEYSDGDEDQEGQVFSDVKGLIKFIRFQNSQYNKQEEGSGIEKLILEIIITDDRPEIPPMAFSQNAINCVLDQCFQQTHKKSLLKHKTDMFMTIDDIEELEEKFKINVYITDVYNRLWRRPAKVHPKRSSHYPTDVFICCHNFHAKKAFRVTKFATPVEKIARSPNALISNFHVAKTPASDVEYLSQRELMNFHIDLLKQGTIHYVIDTGYKVIGLIHNDRYYKDDNLQSYPFISTADWSLSGYARRIFKECILSNKNEEQQLQISDTTVYENIQKSQVPITVLFKQKAHGDIIQIDQTQAYKQSSIGNLDEDVKHFYEGYPTAPRNTININEDLSPQLLIRLSNLGLGFALIDFDQTAHINNGRVPLLHTGKPHPKGQTVLSLPALKYYSLFEDVKVYVKQYYYSRYTHRPFDKPVALFDSLVDDEDQKVRHLTNLLIGGLNKRHHRCKVFSTSSLAEAKRFLADDTKTINRFKTVDRFEDKIAFLDPGVKDTKVTLHKEYIFYYQDDNEKVMESFNMTHLSKYVLDYQKITLHNKARKVCNDNINNLLCINTDSICYVKHSTQSTTDETLWHTEAEGTRFYGYSNGVRCITDGEDIVYQRHSGYRTELTLEDFKVLSDKNNLKVYRQTKKYQTAEEYDTQLENTPLPNQRLHTLFRPAGYGKTEFSRYLSGKESKFTCPQDLKVIEPYREEQILLTGTTHVSRKLLNGKYTIQGLITRLSRNTLKDFDSIKAILIDEISMSSSQQLDKLDRLLRRIKQLNRPFGGLDIYLVGHMKQLPNPDDDSVPVTENELVKKVFTSLNEYLPINHRQSEDHVFQSILTKIESYYTIGGDEKSTKKAKHVLPSILTETEYKALQSRVVNRVFAGDQKHSRKTPTREDYFATPLHFKNRMVEKTNSSIGKIQAGEEVIIRFNRGKFYNGDRHLIQEVKQCEEKGLLVRINNSWLEHDKYFVKQKDEKFPRVQLAHSMTIHCSQGQTLNKIFIYAKSLNMNMLYVAMSRVRNLDSLYLANL
jgi:hypothetical protein